MLVIKQTTKPNKEYIEYMIKAYEITDQIVCKIKAYARANNIINIDQNMLIELIFKDLIIKNRTITPFEVEEFEYKKE